MKSIIYLSFLVFILGACNNTCPECDDEFDADSGNLRVIRNWSNLWQGIMPQELDIYFYSSRYSLQSYRLLTDTTDLIMKAGDYDIIACNNVKGIIYTGMEDYRTATVSVPVWRENDRKITVENLPCLLSANSFACVKEFEQTDCEVCPSPLIKVINFKFRILGDSTNVNITSCCAELNGVEISKMLYQPDKVLKESLATMKFEAMKNGNNIFNKQVSFLGLQLLNPDDLIVFLENKNEKKLKLSIDMRGLLNFSETPVQNCNIDLAIDNDLEKAVVESIKIEAWENGEQGEIEFQ